MARSTERRQTCGGCNSNCTCDGEHCASSPLAPLVGADADRAMLGHPTLADLASVCMARISTGIIGPMVYKRFGNLCTRFLVLLSLAGSLAAQTDKNRQISAHYKQAEAALAVGQAEKAAAEFRQILKLDPANAGAYANLGVIAYKSGDFAQAKQLFTDALKHGPALWDAKAFLGLSEMHTGNRKEGIELIEQSFPHISNGDLKIDAGV